MLYDADCGFCARSAQLIPRIRSAVRVSSLQAEDLSVLGVDAERAVAEMPVVMPDGSIVWGHHAFAAILMAAPQPLRLAGRVLGSRALERVASAGYDLISRNRHRLPGGTASCAIDAAPGGDGDES